MTARCRLSKARRKAINILLTYAHADVVHRALEFNNETMDEHLHVHA